MIASAASVGKRLVQVRKRQCDYIDHSGWLALVIQNAASELGIRAKCPYLSLERLNLGEHWLNGVGLCERQSHCSSEP
jgi:hypothetical protein